ncbi:MAG TPA: hypothetical protein VK174_08850 [Chitinophagales bacterium]|nr:hypothetical protein [Chitinophagales bacterium]
MKSLFHPPSVLFGCDQISIADVIEKKEEKLSDHDIIMSKPTTKLYTPLIMPYAHEPQKPEVKKLLLD